MQFDQRIEGVDDAVVQLVKGENQRDTHPGVDRMDGLKVEHARYLGRMHWLGFNTEVISAERREI